MYILNPDIDEGEISSIVGKFEQVIVDNQGNVEGTEKIGKRKLAYSIKGLTEGIYIITNFLLNPDKIKEVQRVLKMNDSVIRHLVIKKE